MKTNLGTIAIAFFIGALGLTSSCSKKTDSSSTSSIACISSMSDTVQTGVSKTFSSCTASALSYTWNFGDGSAATTATATHIYTTAGVYTGTLTVVTAGGQTGSKTFIITVKDPVLPINAEGSWTFKGISYQADTCVADSGNGYIYGEYDSSATVTRYVEIDFYNYALPTASGTYKVINGAGNPQSPNEVVVLEDRSVGSSDDYYLSTGGNGNQTLTVTVANGKISVTGSNIMLQHYNNPANSSALSFRLNQQ